MTGILRVHIWYGQTRMAGLQSGEGRMIIDSVVWAKYINALSRAAKTNYIMLYRGNIMGRVKALIRE